MNWEGQRWTKKGAGGTPSKDPKSFANFSDPLRETEKDQLLACISRESYRSIGRRSIPQSSEEIPGLLDKKSPELLDFFAVIGPDSMEIKSKIEEMDSANQKSFSFSPKPLFQSSFYDYSKPLPPYDLPLVLFFEFETSFGINQRIDGVDLQIGFPK